MDESNETPKLSREELRQKLRKKINNKSYMRKSNNIKTQNPNKEMLDNKNVQEALQKLSSNDSKTNKKLKKKLNNNNLFNDKKSLDNIKNELLNQFNDKDKFEQFFNTVLHQNQNQNNEIIENDNYENLEEVDSDESE